MQWPYQRHFKLLEHSQGSAPGSSGQLLQVHGKLPIMLKAVTKEAATPHAGPWKMQESQQTM